MVRGDDVYKRRHLKTNSRERRRPSGSKCLTARRNKKTASLDALKVEDAPFKRYTILRISIVHTQYMYQQKTIYH